MSKHIWIQRKGASWQECKTCGMVRRRDDKNNPCNGPAKLRKMEMERADPIYCLCCGADLIARERSRQIAVKGWLDDHDDAHTHHQMAKAAIAYIKVVAYPDKWAEKHDEEPSPHREWPWGDDDWKPSEDPIRNLVKAGALIAAEIDRLQRAKKP